MNKRLTFFMSALLGVVLLFAQTTKSEIKLIATKIEMNGQVKLVWTKAHNADNTTQYNLYRAMVPDTNGVLVYTGSDTTFVDQVPPTMSPLPQTAAYKVIAKTGLNSEASNVFFVPIGAIPPIGSFRLEGKIDSGKVKLSWQAPPINTPVDYYLVYGMPEMSSMMNKIDSTKGLSSVTNLPPVPPGANQEFNYFVRAKLSTGEFLQSTLLELTIENKIPRDELKFVSVPNLNAQKDVPYVYTAKAVSSDPTAVISYSAHVSLGMLTIVVPFHIDSITGIVDWTPATKGYYKVEIVAKSSKGGVLKQYFTVVVAGGNGIIQGKVTDTLTVGIPNAIIEVYKTENNATLSFAYAVRTDPNGNYRINHVDPGTYKLRANAPSTKYQSQWYDGKREVSLADVVTVVDSSVGVSFANFKLRGGVMNAPKVSISGTVKDTLGIAINGLDTRVVFVRVEFALNFGSGMNSGIENFRKYFEYNSAGDFKLEGNSEYVIKAKVDSLGRYKVQLPPGGYIAFARAKGYAVEFYNGQTNILSAEIIRAAKDTTGINFTLSPLPPVVLGEIKGAVLDSVKNITVPSRVIAFRDGWRVQDIHRIGKVYVTDTDSLGIYKFVDLLPGTYVVMALPLGNYAPAFYTTDTMNIRWKRATKITVNGNSVDNINIYVRLFGSSGNGFTGIIGNVNMTGGMGMMNGSNRAGAIVYAYRNNEIVGYSFTNSDGNYAITGLAPGQYSVTVDKAGYNESNTVNVNASYDINGSPLNGTANFTIDGVLSVAVKTPATQPTTYVLGQNYPNPFNPSTAISFSLPHAGNISLKVYNLVGQEVTTLVSGYKEAGQYNVTFNASNFASGVYFYRLQAGSFNVVKKMMLIK